MTHQEIFNKVARHLLVQNKEAMDDKLTCMYRNDDGLKCAIGCLIPDELYTPDIEGTGINDGGGDEVWAILVQAGFNKEEDEELLSALQWLHDGQPPETWRERLRYMAAEFKLEFREELYK
jgi:hypothetical protein